MSKAILRLLALGVALIALGAGAPAAQGAVGDPLFVFVPTPLPSPPFVPPPDGYFAGPCGLAVDSDGNFYVSDYYHDAIDIYSGTSYLAQLAIVDPLDVPCGLALNSSDNLYVNNFHRNVVKFGPRGSFGAGTVFAGPPVSEAHATGVAVDPTTDRVYVDERTYVGVYESSGAPVEEGGEPLRIGEGTLGNGYGLAISRFPATAGYLYVPDAGTDTVKVYDPAIDKANPVATIAGPGSGFNSLRDAAIAVDRVSGNIYVADNLQPAFTEKPQAQVDVFSSTGSFLGVLKYKIVDALPPGLAVDNSPTASQGRVYVTSGNTVEAGVYAYPPGSQVSSSQPTAFTLALASSGSGSGQIASEPGELRCSGTCEAKVRSGAEITLSADPDPGSTFAGWLGEGCGANETCTLEMDAAKSVSAKFKALPSSSSPPAGASTSQATAKASEASITQKGTLRLSVAGKLSPQKLPRTKSAPIAVSVGWSLTTTDESQPPKLKSLGIEINRHGHFDLQGLPTCPYPKIQPATSQRALANCRSALVGKGTFNAEISLGTQEPYATQGRLLIFNGVSKGKPVLFGQIYSPHPFASSFVIVFKLKKLGKGTYGTALSAELPKALANWGNLTGIQMRLARRYSYKGESHSFISAACPAPKGFSKAIFPLARASFDFQGAAELASTFNSTCQARG